MDIHCLFPNRILRCLLILLFLFSCKPQKSGQPAGLFAYVDSLQCDGQKFTVYKKPNGHVFILNAKNDTVFQHKEWVGKIEIGEFYKSGNQSLLFSYSTNTPGECDLIVYMPDFGKFTKVMNFRKFPSAKRIGDGNYWYSYKSVGCADNIWKSDLFKIESYEAKLIASVEVNGCVSETQEKVKATLFRIKENEKVVVREFVPVFVSTPDYKHAFIRNFWAKNYSY
ncbi:hypothetical protein [Fulvitalea axinellae]